MKNKKSIKTAMLIVLAIGLVGGALAYFSAIAKTKNNVFDVFTGQKNEDGGIEIVEPSWKEPTRDSRAVAPGSYLPKDPSVLSNVAYDGWAVMRVRIPKVTSTTETQEAEQLNEIADICYFGANQVAVGSDNPLKIGDIVTFTDGLQGTKTGDLETGTFNSNDFTFLGKLTSREGYNDYYFGYNKILTGGSRTENLFDYIQVKPFKVLTDGTKEKIDSYVDIDAQMVQSVNEDTGAAYTSVTDAWEKVFKKPASSEEFGAVDESSISDTDSNNTSGNTSGSNNTEYYTITYEGNGAKEVGHKYTSIKTKDVPYTVQTINDTPYIRNGYNFTGWNTKADGTGDNYAPGDSYTENSDLTLYALWEQQEIIIIEPIQQRTFTYNGNGDDLGLSMPGQITTNKTITVNSNDFSKSGYRFTGWNTKADGTGDSYAPGDIYTYTNNTSITFYAQWEKDGQTITYMGNGGTCMVIIPGSNGNFIQQKKTNETAKIENGNIFDKFNYTFTGWNTKADGTGDSYAPGDDYSENNDLTLYAQWKKQNMISF